MLDTELAALYGVTTKRFNEQIRRNRERFPADFMFPLSVQEHMVLRLQIATLKLGRGQHRKYLPYAFIEHRAIMAATVLNNQHAVEMSIYVVRAFLKLRELLASNRELAGRFAQLEARLEQKLGTHDRAIVTILSAIRKLMSTPVSKRRPIGFTAGLQPAADPLQYVALQCVNGQRFMRAELGQLEREVLQIIWREDQASADHVRQALRRPLKESTVRTVLGRLEKKGYLAHRVEQRTFLYRAVKPPAHLAARAVQRVADWFCGGSVDAVLLGMVEAKVLSRRDLRRLVNRIDKGRTGED